ncbi:MAG: hypothetical protein Ct9H300mP31_04400 [Acidimicrobiaceae bacterium]|nr:MAG: hypothetical protein Ct9H300mP31_04400 [Acidimicrobiaceae bacterium]
MSVDTTNLLEIPDDGDVTASLAGHGWGDGLPVVAPTPERVAEMLSGCGGADPDEVVAVLPPRFGEASRQTIAVSAVMAGCRPEHLPVVVSAVRALARPELNLRGVNATTHCVAPLLVVHGEVARTAGYNGGLGAFGPGNRANAATGRAVRLVLLHVAGATPGDGDASTQGGPAKYGYCVAENLDASPWAGYAPSIGVDSPSAVTVHCGEAPHNVHDMESDHPARILDKVASPYDHHGPEQRLHQPGGVPGRPVPGARRHLRPGGLVPERRVVLPVPKQARLPAGELTRAFDLRAWAPWRESTWTTTPPRR